MPGATQDKDGGGSGCLVAGPAGQSTELAVVCPAPVKSSQPSEDRSDSQLVLFAPLVAAPPAAQRR